MTNRVMAFFQMTICLVYLTSSAFPLRFPIPNCRSGQYDILLTFDCRVDKSEMEKLFRYFFHLLQYFLTDDPERFVRASVLTLGTMNRQTLLPFTSFNKDNISWEYFQSLYTGSDVIDQCPVNFAVDEVFESTSHGFDQARKDVHKLAIILLIDNSFYMIFRDSVSFEERLNLYMEMVREDATSEQLAELQDEDTDVKRFFIMKKSPYYYKAERIRPFVYPVSDFTHLVELPAAVFAVCDHCRYDMIEFPDTERKSRSCYHVGNSFKNGSVKGCISHCLNLSQGSYALTIESIKELDFLRSRLIPQINTMYPKLINIHVSFDWNFITGFQFNYVRIPNDAKKKYKVEKEDYSAIWQFRPLDKFNETFDFHDINSCNKSILMGNYYTDNLFGIQYTYPDIEYLPVCEIIMTVPGKRSNKTISVNKARLDADKTLIDLLYFKQLYSFIDLFNDSHIEIDDICPYMKGIRTSERMIDCGDQLSDIGVNLKGFVCKQLIENINKHKSNSRMSNNALCYEPVKYIRFDPTLAYHLSYDAIKNQCLFLNASKDSIFTRKCLQGTDLLKCNTKKYDDVENDNEYLQTVIRTRHALHNLSHSMDPRVQLSECDQGDPADTHVFHHPSLHRLRDEMLMEETMMNIPTFITGNYTRVPRCIYIKSVTMFPNRENIVRCIGDSHLDKCEDFVCPPGYFKCPRSYCVEFFHVADGLDDCENGEDEQTMFSYSGVPSCTAHITTSLAATCVTSALKDIVFDHSVKVDSHFCNSRCPPGFRCMSGIVQMLDNKETSYVIKTFEINTRLLNISGSLRPPPSIERSFLHFKHLEFRAQHCNISNFDQSLVDMDFSNLLILDLSYNNLTGDDIKLFRLMVQLRHLNFSQNVYMKTQKMTYFPVLLEVIDLSYTNIDLIHRQSFALLTNLKHLNLSHTMIQHFNSMGLPAYFILHSLNLRGADLKSIHLNYFQGLFIKSALLVDDYKLCCQQVAGPNVPQDKCLATSFAILSSCNDLIGDPLKRGFLWLVSCIAFLGNLLVVIYRLTWEKSVLKKSYGLFVSCLGLSDLTMGIYLLFIATADVHYRNNYVLNDLEWRHGYLCKLTGVLVTLSSESSAFFICLITIDRYLIMRYPFGQHRISKAFAVANLIFIGFFSFVLALTPAVLPGWEIYSSNSMCLALPLNIGLHDGWQYSVSLFIVLNSFLFLFIAFGQFLVFISFINNKFPAGTAISTSRTNDLEIAKHLAFVAISDFLCWFPIGIMGFMSLGGQYFGKEAYEWSAVLIIPVNSALNPLIYTMPTVFRKLIEMKSKFTRK